MNLFHLFNGRMNQVVESLVALTHQGRLIMATLADIQAAVAAQSTVEQGVVALLQQLSSELKAAMDAEDPAALQGVLDMLNLNTKALSDAVLANTPAAAATPAAPAAFDPAPTTPPAPEAA